MKNKHLLLLSVLLLIALGISACSRAASTPPPMPATDTGGFPVPGTQTMGIFDTFATQTAMAQEQGGGVPQDTPVPPATTVGEEPTTAPPAESPTQPESPTEPSSPPAAEAIQPPPPEPAQPPVFPTATPGIPASYTLQKGEHPYCIARRFNLNPADLLTLNGLSVNTVLQPGRELRIPQTGRSFPASRALLSHPTNYTVRSGDTIYSIACAFGDVDPNTIAAANDLSAPYNLTAGQTLYIP
jgi:LysM repeat protein